MISLLKVFISEPFRPPASPGPFRVVSDPPELQTDPKHFRQDEKATTTMMMVDDRDDDDDDDDDDDR